MHSPICDVISVDWHSALSLWLIGNQNSSNHLSWSAKHNHNRWGLSVGRIVQKIIGGFINVIVWAEQLKKEHSVLVWPRKTANFSKTKQKAIPLTLFWPKYEGPFPASSRRRAVKGVTPLLLQSSHREEGWTIVTWTNPSFWWPMAH